MDTLLIGAWFVGIDFEMGGRGMWGTARRAMNHCFGVLGPINPTVLVKLVSTAQGKAF